MSIGGGATTYTLTLTDPGSGYKITCTDSDIQTGGGVLTITGGSGDVSGTVTAGALVDNCIVEYPAGRLFVDWTGDGYKIADGHATYGKTTNGAVVVNSDVSLGFTTIADTGGGNYWHDDLNNNGDLDLRNGWNTYGAVTWSIIESHWVEVPSGGGPAIEQMALTDSAVHPAQQDVYLHANVWNIHATNGLNTQRAIVARATDKTGGSGGYMFFWGATPTSTI